MYVNELMMLLIDVWFLSSYNYLIFGIFWLMLFKLLGDGINW